MNFTELLPKSEVIVIQESITCLNQNGFVCNDLLKDVNPPLGWIVAFKAVALRAPAAALWDRRTVHTVTYNRPYPYELVSSSCALDCAVNYAPGQAAIPAIKDSRLFVYKDYYEAKTFARSMYAIFRCFVPEDSQYFEHMIAPADGGNSADNIKSAWRDGQLIIGIDWPIYLKKVLLAEKVILMDRLDWTM